MEVGMIGMQVPDELLISDHEDPDYDYDGIAEVPEEMDPIKYRELKQRTQKSLSAEIVEPAEESQEGRKKSSDGAKGQEPPGGAEAVLAVGHGKNPLKKPVLKDAITGQELDPVLVRAARRK